MFSVIGITPEEKYQLLKTANEIIEAEEKSWPKALYGEGPSFWGDLSTVKGRDIRKK